MNRIMSWVGGVLILLLLAQTGFAATVSTNELSGRGGEKPIAILIDEEEIFVAFQDPAQVVRYDAAWNELGVLDLPEDFKPDDMILVNGDFWLLDKFQDVILQIDGSTLQLIQAYGGNFERQFASIFEADGSAFVMDENGYVYQINKEFSIQGWMSGLILYQSVFYDGYHVYIGGRITPSKSGVLVKTQENELEDEWLMSDDSRAPKEVDVVERIRLLPDGFFYVIYRETGLVKYDEFGNYRNRYYQRSTEERVFRDIAMDTENAVYYLADETSGIFEVRWMRDRRISIRKKQEETSGLRLSTRTVSGVTTAQIGEGKLSGFYREEDAEFHMLMPTRNVDRLKLRIPVADLIHAQEQGMNALNVHWKDEAVPFQFAGWDLKLREGEHVEAQYVEINISLSGSTVDACWVEQLDEKTKTVRREKLE